METDIELLRRYADFKDEKAFAALVDRHVSFVYSAALRQLNGAAHRAEDVTQTVFIQLARNATKLIRSDELLGWLHTATHHAAANLKRSEARRQQREREAHVMENDAHEPLSALKWDQVRPVLDEAMLELEEKDRRALLLRFFQQTRFSDVGRMLGLSEDAARMRVERALERLHARLARRGITSTAGALALALANQTTIAAPAGLAATITSAAAANAAVGGVAIGLFSMSTKTVVLATIAVVATSSAIYEFRESRRAAATLTTIQRERDNFRAQARAADQRAEQADQDLLKLQGAVEAARAANAATEAKIAALAQIQSNRVSVPSTPTAGPLSRLAQPVAPPENLDPRYTPAAVMDAFVRVSRNVGLNLRGVMVDDSEFPFIVYGRADGNLTEVKAALRTTPGYIFDGAVSGPARDGSTGFAISITPLTMIKDIDDRATAHGRMIARLQALEKKAKAD